MKPTYRGSQSQPFQSSIIPFAAKWQAIRDMGEVLVRSGMLPESIRTPEQAAAIILKGDEIGMKPMQSFAHIHIIKGRACLSAEGMMARVLEDFPTAKIDFIQNDDIACIIEATRPGSNPNRFSFSFDDAQKAKITGNENWTKYRRAMLRSRCVSEMCRALFPDAIQGCSYTEEEMLEIEESKMGIQNVKIAHNILPKSNSNPGTVLNEPPSKEKEILASFISLGITEETLCDLIDKPLNMMNDSDIKLMRDVYVKLRDKIIDPLDIPMLKELLKSEIPE